MPAWARAILSSLMRFRKADLLPALFAVGMVQPPAVHAGNVLLVVGGETLAASDIAVRSLAEQLGHTVTVVDSGTLEMAQAAGKNLIMISRSVGSWTPPPGLKETEVPIISWSVPTWIHLGLIEPGSEYTPEVGRKYLGITFPDHPVSAGLSGSIQVCNTYVPMELAYPAGAGGLVMTFEPESWYSASILYDLGAYMAREFEAPARRMGMFHCQEPLASLTEDGRSLTKAAIAWTMQPVPPSIRLGPQAQTLRERQSAFFSVDAKGWNPMSYQWLRNGIPIPGATQSQYTTTGSTLDDNGATFRCIVENSAGSDTSEAAVLTVLPRGAPATTELVSVAGELSAADGTPVGAGTPILKDITVRIFPVPEGGAALHEEAFLAADGLAVPVKDGRFVLRLGQGASRTEFQDLLFVHPNLYAEFLVGNPGAAPETLAPRIPITASASAGTPRMLRGAGKPGTAAQVGTLYQNLSDNTVWVRVAHSWMRLSLPDDENWHKGN